MQTCACCPCWSGIGSEFFTVLENGDLLACCAPCLESSRRASTWKDGKLIFESRYSRYFSGRPTCQVYCSAGCWTFVQKTLILSPHAHLVVVKKKVKRINSLFDKRPVVQVSKKKVLACIGVRRRTIWSFSMPVLCGLSSQQWASDDLICSIINLKKTSYLNKRMLRIRSSLGSTTIQDR